MVLLLGMMTALVAVELWVGAGSVEVLSLVILVA